MANIKKGFIYYSVETNRYEDKRIKKLKKDMGCAGLCVYDKILCEIYRVEGCFIQWDEDTVFDVADYFGLKETLVAEIVAYCCNVGLFKKELYAREKVLSSLSIQSRFTEWSKKAKRKEVKIPEKYVIIQEESAKLPEEYTQTSCILPQSKVKESKVKKSKVVNEGAHTPDEIDLFNGFEKWVSKYTPRVNHLKEPLTIDDYFNLRKKVSKEVLENVLKAMQNRADLLKKYISAYLTILNWSKREEDPAKGEATVITIHEKLKKGNGTN